jgi:hypothetical protein
MSRGEYRQDAHTASLFVWMLLCAAVAAFLFIHSGKIASRPLRTAEIAGGVALLLFGPAGLAVYLYRARHVWVGVDRQRGLQVSGRGYIPWEAIERVERRKPLLRGKGGPARVGSLGEMGKFEELDGLGGCLVVPEAGLLVLGIGLLLVAFLAFCWLVFLVLIPLVLVPVLEVCAPLGERVKIVPREGRSLVPRDLRDADALLLELRRRVPVVER